MDSAPTYQVVAVSANIQRIIRSTSRVRTYVLPAFVNAEYKSLPATHQVLLLVETKLMSPVVIAIQVSHYFV